MSLHFSGYSSVRHEVILICVSYSPLRNRDTCHMTPPCSNKASNSTFNWSRKCRGLVVRHITKGRQVEMNPIPCGVFPIPRRSDCRVFLVEGQDKRNTT